MQFISRIAITFLLAVVTSLGVFVLAGCTDNSQQSESSATQSQSASSSASSASDDDQDNCYGNDMPAKK